MIVPSIGRKVWFRPVAGEHPGMVIFGGEQALDATVVYVWNKRMVNLLVRDHEGREYPVSNVTLVQEGDSIPENSFCEWMPYQRGQAAKVEELQSTSDKNAMDLSRQVGELTDKIVTQEYVLDASIENQKSLALELGKAIEEHNKLVQRFNGLERPPEVTGGSTDEVSGG